MCDLIVLIADHCLYIYLILKHANANLLKHLSLVQISFFACDYLLWHVEFSFGNPLIPSCKPAELFNRHILTKLAN